MTHNRVIFSGQHQMPEAIAQQQRILRQSISNFYAQKPTWLRQQFADFTLEEYFADLQVRTTEIERDGCLALLAAVEAAFRVDYLERVYSRRKDPLSRAFRQMHQTHGNKLRLDEDLLEMWLMHTNIAPDCVGKLRGALKYRHWLAHGRY